MSNIESISGKTLAMFVGPSGSGKSTIMEEIVQLDPNFAYVRAVTTREPRPGERSHYRHISKAQVDLMRERGQFITLSEHPTTHHIYGSDSESYPKNHNLLDTLSGNVKDFRTLPFKETTTLGVAAPTENWQEWFTSRYPEPTDEAQRRLEEARISLNWALDDTETYWLINRAGTLREVARTALATILCPPPERSIPEEPYTMLELIDRGMWD